MEWRNARPVLISAVLVAIGTVTGPFGTFPDMTYGERFIYWTLAIVGVAAPVNIFTPLMIGAPALQRLHVVLRILVGCLIATPFGALVILGLDVWFDRVDFTFVQFWSRVKFVFLIGFGIRFVESYVRPRAMERLLASQSGSVPAEPTPFTDDVPPVEPIVSNLPPSLTRGPDLPLFLRNLDGSLGTELISITTEDHYLRVVTRDGEDRILKRMSDALAELEEYPGLQIHRSHWIALDAVDRVEREGRKCHVVLENGMTLPVSRPNIPALNEALAQRV